MKPEYKIVYRLRPNSTVTRYLRGKNIISVCVKINRMFDKAKLDRPIITQVTEIF